MAKAFMSSDWHFGVYPLSLEKWLNTQVKYFDEQLIPYIKENAKEGDIFLHLGDLFEDRTSIPILALNEAERILKEISEILPIHLIVGNHDLWNKGDNKINSPKPFNWMPNVNIYSKTTSLNIDNKKLVLMPWIETKDEMIREINDNPGDYLFCHSDLNGCKMHLSSVAHKNVNKINIESFSGYDNVFSGHIHIRQKNKNFTFIGAPYQMDRNDYGDTKGLTVLNIKTGQTKFIPNEVSPTFKKFKIENKDDIEVLKNLDTSKHYVDLEINNSVLIDSRKSRLDLQNIFETKKFSDVNYINDIIKEKTEEERLKEVEVSLDDIEITELEDFIIEYTKNQKFKNQKFKDGCLNELLEVIDIYHKEYKFKKE